MTRAWDSCGAHFLSVSRHFFVFAFKNMRGKSMLTIAGGIKQPRYKQSSQPCFCSSILNSILDKCEKGLDKCNKCNLSVTTGSFLQEVREEIFIFFSSFQSLLLDFQARRFGFWKRGNNTICFLLAESL